MNQTPLPSKSVRPLLVSALWILVAISCTWVIYIGKPLLIPLVLAFLAVYLVATLSAFCQKIPFIGKHLPNWGAGLLAHLIIIALAIGMFSVIADNASVIVEKSPIYQHRLQSVYSSTVTRLGLDEVETLSELRKILRVGPMLGSVASGLTGLMGNAFLVVLFFFFIGAERKYLLVKMERFFDDEQKMESFSRIWSHIDRDIRTYLGVKTFMSLLVGLGGYLILRVVGVDFPAFWALLLFLLNYIPNIGSFIATALPTMLALVQFGSLQPALIVLAAVTALQVTVGNLLEPQLMGRSLNLSPLVVILSLTFWGGLWGIAGMLLCVPFTVISMICFSNFPASRRIAILLSKSGVIKGTD
jgi:AI-2 transport protein TqsA